MARNLVVTRGMRRLYCLVWHRALRQWVANVDGYWHCRACRTDRYL